MKETPKPKRPRIGVTEKGKLVETDPQAFVKNKCSDKAKKTFDHKATVRISGWIDQHLHIRQQQGDEYGKRDGIDPVTVEGLVKESLKYLLLYSALVKGFKFINHPQVPETNKRIILRKDNEGFWLYVVIEVHFLAVQEFEITIITAMQEADFRVGAGQYVVEIQEGTSTLYKFDNEKFSEICSF
jgi:hypothetical protein